MYMTIICHVNQVVNFISKQKWWRWVHHLGH